VVHEISKYFPQFIWAIRDFSLDLFDNRLNRVITSKEYLESALLLDSSASKQKQAVRLCIREYFRERDCFTLPRPINDEKLLRNIEEVNYEHLKEPFKI
jgi:Guanylate-binding protein, N-terminal domain